MQRTTFRPTQVRPSPLRPNRPRQRPKRNLRVTRNRPSRSQSRNQNPSLRRMNRVWNDHMCCFNCQFSVALSGLGQVLKFGIFLIAVQLILILRGLLVCESAVQLPENRQTFTNPFTLFEQIISLQSCWFLWNIWG